MSALPPPPPVEAVVDLVGKLVLLLLVAFLGGFLAGFLFVMFWYLFALSAGRVGCKGVLVALLLAVFVVGVFVVLASLGSEASGPGLGGGVRRRLLRLLLVRAAFL